MAYIGSGNKSQQSKDQSKERKDVAQDRHAKKVNVHNGAAISQSGAPKKK